MSLLLSPGRSVTGGEDIKHIRDWIIPFIQSFVLFSLLVFLICFDGIEVASSFLTKAKMDRGELPFIIRFAYGFGRVGFSIVVLMMARMIVCRDNKETVLKPTVTNKIIWHSYYGYVFCRYVLGFERVSLVRLPIPVQFKLVCKDLFVDYDVGKGVYEKDESKPKYTLVPGESYEYTNELNLVLADTYGIDVERQLPQSVSKWTTIIIDRSSDNHTRYFSHQFVSEVISRVRALPKNVHVINLFATTNPMHTLRIAQDVFMTGGCDSIEHFFVYQQSTSEGRPFEGKRLKIY